MISAYNLLLSRIIRTDRGYALVYGILFLGCLVLNALRHGLQTPVVDYNHLLLTSPADDVVTQYGEADAASYIKAARDVLAGKPIREMIPLNCWPPGLVLLEAALLSTVPGHFTIALFTITSTLWASAIGGFASLLRQFSGSTLFPGLLVGLFGVPVFGLYFFQAGIFMSESLSVALFLLALINFIGSIRKRSIALAAASGLLAAAAALTRGQWLFAMVALIGMSAAIGLGTFLWMRARRRRLQPSTVFGVRAACIAASVYLACVYSYAWWHHGGVLHMDYEFQVAWEQRTQPNWQDHGGVDVLCDADHELCTRLHAKPDLTWQEGRVASIHTLEHHLGYVLVHKARYFALYFISETSWFPVDWTRPDYYESGVFLALAMIGAIGSLQRWRRPLFLWLLVLQAAVWAGTCAAPFSIMHFEVRYLYIGKAVSLFAALIVLADAYRARRAHPHYVETMG